MPLLPLTVNSECDDGAGRPAQHLRPQSQGIFQDCNSRLAPHHDAAGTFAYHGWWINDHVCNGDFAQNCNWNGPYSDYGKARRRNARFHTYRNDHTDGKSVAVFEYPCPGRSSVHESNRVFAISPALIRQLLAPPSSMEEWTMIGMH